MVMQMFSTILQIVLFRRQSEQEKDLEILLLRRQLAILERYHTQRTQVSRVAKFTLTIPANYFRLASGWSMQRLRMVLLVLQPETAFTWHRELEQYGIPPAAQRCPSPQAPEHDGSTHNPHLNPPSYSRQL